MEREILLRCLNGAAKEIQIGIDKVLDSSYSDNVEDGLLTLLKSAYNCEIDCDCFEDLCGTIEYDSYQSCLLSLIKVSYVKGFETGFRAKVPIKARL